MINKALSLFQEKKNIFLILIFLLFSFVYFLVVSYLLKLHGPSWICVPSDLDYINLLNGLNILTDKPSTLFVHPDITTVYSYAIFIYFIHLVFGGLNLVSDVISRAEIYMQTIIYLYLSITSLSLFYLGNSVYKYTKNVFLSIFSQIYLLIFIGSYDVLYQLNNASAENIQTICSILLVAISLRFVRNGLSKGEIKTVVILSLLACLAVASKFTGAMLLLFPLIIVPGRWLKFIYILTSLILLFLFFIPLYGNFDTFYAQIASEFFVILHNHSIAGEHSYLQTMIDGLRSLYHSYYFYLTIMDIVGCVVIFFTPPWRRASKKDFNFILAYTTISILSIAMVINRPNYYYLGAYLIFPAMGFFAIIHLIWKNIKLSKVRIIFSILAISLLILSFFSIYLSVKNIDQDFSKVKLDALTINQLVQNNYKQDAVVSAIHASNLTVGLKHAFEGFYQEIGNALPENSFLYALFADYNTYFDRYNYIHTLDDLYRRYPGIVFHTENYNFKDFFDKDLKFITLYHGKIESLQTINQIPGSSYQPLGVKGNSQPDGGFSAASPNCVMLTFRGDYSYVLGGYVLSSNDNNQFISMLHQDSYSRGNFVETAKPPMILRRDFNMPIIVQQYRLGTGSDGIDSTGRMPISWKLSASNDGVHWQLIDKRSNQPNWHLNEIRVFSIASSKSYRFYEFKFFNHSKINVIRIYNIDFVFNNKNSSLMPQRWIVKASNHGKSWTKLDSRQFLGRWKSSERKRFIISNKKYYKYIKFCSLKPKSEWLANIRPLYQITGVKRKLLKFHEAWIDFHGYSPYFIDGNVLLSGKSEYYVLSMLHKITSERGSFIETTKPPMIIRRDFNQPIIVKQYRLGTGADGIDATSRMPIAWELNASNDGKEWILIDSKTNQRAWRLNELRTFHIYNPKPFRFYELRLFNRSGVNVVRVYNWDLVYKTI